MKRVLVVILGVWLVLSIAGCGKKKARSGNDREITDYAGLPSVRNTSFQPLLDEMDRIESEKATPSQLNKSQRKPPDSAVKSEQLQELFPPARRHTLQQARRLMPKGRFQFDPTLLERISSFLTTHQKASRQFSELIQRPHVNLELNFDRGMLTDYSVLDSFELAAYTEAFNVAKALEEEDPHRAIDSVASLFRMARLLGRESHLMPRIAAAQRRLDAIRVVEYFARHRMGSRTAMQDLFEQVEGQLAYWPNERNVWVAERANGLHLYEMVRDGQILSLLSEDEIAALTKDRVTNAMLLAISKTIDQDQLYYLSAMRQIIFSSNRPYYKRRQVLADVRANLNETRGTTDYPLVADKLLLGDFETAHRWMGEERAACEAMSLCLAIATGRTPPVYKANPLTGKPFQLEQTGDSVRVTGLTIGGNPFTIEVPVRTD